MPLEKNEVAPARGDEPKLSAKEIESLLTDPESTKFLLHNFTKMDCDNSGSLEITELKEFAGDSANNEKDRRYAEAAARGIGAISNVAADADSVKGISGNDVYGLWQIQAADQHTYVPHLDGEAIKLQAIVGGILGFGPGIIAGTITGGPFGAPVGAAIGTVCGAAAFVLNEVIHEYGEQIATTSAMKEKYGASSDRFRSELRQEIG